MSCVDHCVSYRAKMDCDSNDEDFTLHIVTEYEISDYESEGECSDERKT